MIIWGYVDEGAEPERGAADPSDDERSQELVGAAQR